MDIASVFGVLAILFGVGGLVYVWLIHKGYLAPPAISAVRHSRFTESAPTFTRPVGRSDELVQASAGQTVTLLGEPERAVKASVTLYEMFQDDPQGPWKKTGNASKALMLAGGAVIFKVPSRESGKPIWLRAIGLDTAGLGKFYKGSPTSPGPARQFKENGQTDPVPYELPRDLTPGVNWEVVDIGRFHAEVDGRNDNIADGDDFPFVTSHERGGQRWLLYLDARKENAKGSGGLFFGEPFEPSVEVTDLM